MAAPLQERQLDALREDADRFIAELDEEAYLHFAGLKATYDLVADLRAARRADEARNRARSRRVGERWPKRPRALALRLRGLSRELRQRGRGEDRRGGDEARSKVGGEEIAYRDLRPRIANADDRDARERLERARNDATEEHMTPLYLRSARSSTARRRSSAPPTYTELYRGFQFPLDDLAEQCRALPRVDRAPVGGRGRPLLPQPHRAGARRDRALGRARVWRGADVGRGVPEGPHGARARGDARRPRRRPARAAERRARPRGPPEQVAARVLRPDRGPRPRRPRDQAAGRARRLALALPRGRAHRALRAHVRVAHGRGAPARRQRGHRGLGDAARARDDGPGRGSSGGSTSRVRTSTRPKARRSCSGLVRRYCAKLLYELEFHAADDVRRCSRATSSYSATR